MTDQGSTLDQLEDALLKFLPLVGAILGAAVLGGLLTKTKVPPILCYMAGGATGAVIFGLTLKLLLRVINPNRDRSA